jgi:glycerate kinase
VRLWLLAPDKFDDRLTALDCLHNIRQRAQHQFDQLSITYIADPDPEDCWAAVCGGPAQREVAVLGDENR